MSKWMFRTSSSMFLLVLSMIIGWSVFAQYAMSYWDQKVLDQVDQVVSEYIENENKEGLFRKLVLLKQKESQFEDDAQALFMIYEVKKIIQDAINTIGQIDASADVSVSNFVSWEEEIEIKEEVVEEESPVVEVDQVQETVLTNTPPTPFKQMSKQDFYDTYAPFLLDASPIPDRCDNSRYANENFTQARWWRDGIVATVIKVIGRELERR